MLGAARGDAAGGGGRLPVPVRTGSATAGTCRIPVLSRNRTPPAPSVVTTTPDLTVSSSSEKPVSASRRSLVIRKRASVTKVVISEPDRPAAATARRRRAGPASGRWWRAGAPPPGRPVRSAPGRAVTTGVVVRMPRSWQLVPLILSGWTDISTGEDAVRFRCTVLALDGRQFRVASLGPASCKVRG